MRRGVVNNALEDEAERDNRGLSESLPAVKDCFPSPRIRISVESDTYLYLRRSGSILGAYCGSTTIRRSREENTFYTSIRPFNHEIEKTICSMRIMSGIRQQTKLAM